MSTGVHALPMLIMTSLSVVERFIPGHMNWSTNFRGLTCNEEMAPSRLKYNFICFHVEINDSC